MDEDDHIDSLDSSSRMLEIKTKIANKTYSLVEVRNPKLRSIVWNTFMHIIDGDGNTISDFVCCGVCKNVLKFLRRNGNSNLSKHKCTKLKKADQTGLKYFFTAPKNLSLTEQQKKGLEHACVSFIVNDIRPMHALQGFGLAQLLSLFTMLGMKYGILSPDQCVQVLPHPTTISRKIHKMGQEMIPLLSDLMSPIYDNIGGAMTIDIWSDNYKKRSYMGITTHFIDDDFKMHDRILATAFIPPEVAKTGINLKSEIFKILRQFKLFEALLKTPKRIIFVTDRGSNLICGLKDYTRLNCFAHLINNLTKTACKVIDINDGVLETCRAVVSYIKRVGLNEFEHGALKMAVETRWNSNYDMLESISKNWTQVLDLLEKRNASEKLNDVQKSDIDAILAFLKPMKEATIEAEASKRPSLYLVQLFVQLINSHLEVKSTDTEVVMQMKEQAKIYFDANIANCVSMYHTFSVYLHPMFKSLRSFPSNERDNIVQNVSIHFIKKTFT